MSDGVLIAGDETQPGRGGLQNIVAALYGYLLEIDGYRDVCLRCEATATVREHPFALEVLRYYSRRDETITQVRSAVGRLSDRVHRGRRRLPSSAALSRSQAHDHSPPLLRERIVWENRTAVVDVSAPDATRLRVSLLFPALESDLPELPLRTLTHALRCHEFLVPAALTTPLPAEQETGALTLRDYLKRTMPRNLSASQWLFRPGAG